jgi:ATP-dependent RNA helicase DDX51/DBP6
LTEALPVQTALIPLLLAGPNRYSGDICVSAPTGSGKTLAYLLPLVQILKTKLVTRLRAIIVVPTRELVSQARKEAETVAAGTGVRVGVAFGGKSLKEEQVLLVGQDQRYDPDEYKRMEEVARSRFETGFDEDDSLVSDLNSLLPGHVYEQYSKVDILICTPGRLVEHINSTVGFSLQHLEYLIVDEADRLLDDSFQEWVSVVLSTIQQSIGKSARERLLATSNVLVGTRKVQKVILSATMTRDLAKLASLQLRQPILVGLEPDHKDGDAMDIDEVGHIELPLTLQEKAASVGDGSDKPLYLLQLLENLLQNETKAKILVFTNTTEDAMRLEYLMSTLQPTLANQLGTLTKTTSKSGRKALSSFTSGKKNVLIATDRASRGLDVPDLNTVISYDMPKDLTTYIHRAGRTARAGKSGVAWSFFTNSEGRWFWNSIARAVEIRRNSPVERNQLENTLGEDITGRYSSALEDLKNAVHAKQ